MKKHILLKTNVLVCLIIVIGFCVTAVLGYESNYTSSLESIEQVSALTSEGIYYQLTTLFSRPVNISLTMANDSLLKECLKEEPFELDNAEYESTIARYLEGYQKKYEYDSVFLASSASARYYNFNGVDRVLTPDNPENVWYYEMLESQGDYSLNVDNDEVEGANNDITIFVNCKIKDTDGSILGIVGVGLKVNYLQELLSGYEKEFGVEAYLVDDQGTIQISTAYSGYETVDMFELKQLESVRGQVLGWEQADEAQTIWVNENREAKKAYVVTRYIPELSWHLIVECNTGVLVDELNSQLYQNIAVIMLIILVILSIITYVIRSFNTRILDMARQQEETFRKATEALYDNIYELNITKNRAGGKSTERYFESIGVPGNTPYSEALVMIAQKQIKEEFREGYINMFSPENVIREYEQGNTHLRYDFMMKEDGSDYFWMRIDANTYYCAEDATLRMFTYRKNIDAQKRQEISIEEQIRYDEMTGFYTKSATERQVTRRLREKKGMYAFFIFDIDNFKQANDQHGHAFGDAVIKEFTKIIRSSFRRDDLLGRIGGDEFAALIPVPDIKWLEEKAGELSKALDREYAEGADRWKISASIGISMAPRDGSDFDSLYRRADAALYVTKRNGKNGFTVYDKGMEKQR